MRAARGEQVAQQRDALQMAADELRRDLRKVRSKPPVPTFRREQREPESEPESEPERQTERETEREQVNSSTRDGACASDAVRYVLSAPTVAHLCRYVHSSRALRCFTAGRTGI